MHDTRICFPNQAMSSLVSAVAALQKFKLSVQTAPFVEQCLSSVVASLRCMIERGPYNLLEILSLCRLGLELTRMHPTEDFRTSAGGCFVIWVRT